MGNHMGHCSDVSARISNSHNTQTASASGPSKITSKTMSTSAVFCFFLASGASKVTTKTKPTSEVPTLTIPPYQEQKATKRLPPTRFEGEKAHLHRKRLSPPRSEGEKAHLHRKRLSPPRPEVSGASKVTSKPESTSANSSLTGPSFNKKSTTKGLPLPRSEGEILSSPNLKAFSFGELRNATRNFRPDSLLGEGGFGYVFKGWIDEHTFSAVKPGSGMVVAVKKLKPEGFQGHKEWLTEVNYLGQLHHPNLVKLIGYCLDGENRLLVYEFMPKGSLENHLFRRGTQPLSWEIRIKVAIGAARGLSFLHDAESQVIYRDVKASNILLDAEFNAKLSDFGLAKAGPTGDRTHVSTQVMGTHGYAAPEYMATGRLSAKSDVYSFGVVLLELLTGRHAVDKTRVSAEQNLVDWARQYLVDKRKLFRIMDTKLEGQYSQKGAFMAANLALHCLNHGPKARPRMAEVLAKLEQIQALKRRTQFEKQEASNANQRSPLRHHHLPHDQPASYPP